LGAGYPGGACFGGGVFEDNSGGGLNPVLNMYLKGPPPSNYKVLVLGSDVRGIEYTCRDKPSNDCTAYRLRWYMEGTTGISCGGGKVFATADGQTLCYITPDLNP
jgi:hypothetical protein